MLNLVRSVSGTRLNRTGTATEKNFEVILVHLIGRDRAFFLIVDGLYWENATGKARGMNAV